MSLTQDAIAKWSNLPYNSTRPEGCITDLNPMVPVPDYMRAMFHHLSSCGDAASLEASLWIMHAASLADHALSIWECTRLLRSVMRGMCIAAPNCGKSFPHSCFFENNEESQLDIWEKRSPASPKGGGIPSSQQKGKANVETSDTPKVDLRLQTDCDPATLSTIAFDLESVLRGIRKSGGVNCLSLNNPLCHRVHNAVQQVCCVVSKLYDVILLSHLCHSTPGCCKKMPVEPDIGSANEGGRQDQESWRNEREPGTLTVQSYMVFRMLPVELAIQNTCDSLPFSLNLPQRTGCESGHVSNVVNDMNNLNLGHGQQISSPWQQVSPSWQQTTLLHLQQVLSSAARSKICGKRGLGTARRAMHDVWVNHWAMYINCEETSKLFAPNFVVDLTQAQLNTIKEATTRLFKILDLPSLNILAECLERRDVLTDQQLGQILPISKVVNQVIANFQDTMSEESKCGPQTCAYMTDIMMTSTWCYSHRFDVSNRELLYMQEVNECMERCNELGKQWQPFKHIYRVDASVWETEFSNWVANMMDFRRPLSECCPPVLTIVNVNEPGFTEAWKVNFEIYNPVANRKHIVTLPLNLALRVAKALVHDYFQKIKKMEVPRTLKNVPVMRKKPMVVRFD